ncbi:hypothetical protein CEXT_5211 [Caerostris extrusa]|uniref:Uncharacterized protein n=1 Tax=Caerostris extrusa TaxID=172846 RepID=A0AAV4PLQ2_CAEEX|nr:hypothetical protein CEXT_5211 [Caerostris extrusa]
MVMSKELANYYSYSLLPSIVLGRPTPLIQTLPAQFLTVTFTKNSILVRDYHLLFQPELDVTYSTGHLGAANYLFEMWKMVFIGVGWFQLTGNVGESFILMGFLDGSQSVKCPISVKCLFSVGS